MNLLQIPSEFAVLPSGVVEFERYSLARVDAVQAVRDAHRVHLERALGGLEGVLQTNNWLLVTEIADYNLALVDMCSPGMQRRQLFLVNRQAAALLVKGLQ